jgi:hypothetical protein
MTQVCDFYAAKGSGLDTEKQETTAHKGGG